PRQATMSGLLSGHEVGKPYSDPCGRLAPFTRLLHSPALLPAVGKRETAGRRLGGNSEPAVATPAQPVG
ncbi:MAG: hypothetical protein ACRDIV_14425, partial [Ktedonobacteraceae bacterium]